jgi:hypothetical protein
MTDIAVSAYETDTSRFAGLLRIVLFAAVAAALLAGAFTIGRVTTGSSTHTITKMQPYVVQQGPAGQPNLVCHLHGPC